MTLQATIGILAVITVFNLFWLSWQRRKRDLLDAAFLTFTGLAVDVALLLAVWELTR